MALTVKDVLELPSGEKLKLIAGEGGLNRPVVTVEVADYEFDPDIDYDAETGMEPGGFVITSLLFAKNDPSLIVDSMRRMYECGMSCLAYKKVIYEDLPKEAIDFAKEKDFPVFAMEMDLWFENIIFDIKYAVQFDDKTYLSEQNIDAMLDGRMSRSDMDTILKGISLKMQPYISVVHISDPDIDVGRVLRSYYQLKGFQRKALMVRYEDAIFMIITSGDDAPGTHDIIRNEAFELLGISKDSRWGMSCVHEMKAIDRAFRQSRLCLEASRIMGGETGKRIHRFRETGACRVILTSADGEESKAFAEDLLGSAREKPDLMETIEAYVDSGGDIGMAAGMLRCHQNTIRYRLARVRKLAGLDDVSEGELYMQLKTAVMIDRS